MSLVASGPEIGQGTPAAGARPGISMTLAMTGESHIIGIVIPTIGRYAELRRMLESVARQTRLPEQVIVVGEGHPTTMAEMAHSFSSLDIQFLSLPRPSTCEARNAGMRAARPELTLVAFMDDDIVLEPTALEAVLAFWNSAPQEVAGAALNLLNHPPLWGAWLKSLPITSWLGLYDSQKGAVLRSGMHTLIGHQKQRTYVRWLPTGAVVYARRVLEGYSFDEWFRGYSYLEDLDFSYRIGKQYRLTVVRDASFYHYPSEIGRPSWYLFGKKEVLNRLYFVSKHAELSRPLCCLALSIRALMSVFLGLARFESRYFRRTAGNLAAFLALLSRGLRPTAQ